MTTMDRQQEQLLRSRNRTIAKSFFRQLRDEGFSHEQIIERRKDEYYFALRSSQATFRTQTNPEGPRETIAPWLNFFLSAIKEQATKSLALVQADSDVDTMSPKHNKVLEYLLGVREAGPSEIAMATNILLPTVRKSLIRLVELGQVKRVGRGRATRYVKI
jgi:hypothetical protein